MSGYPLSLCKTASRHTYADAKKAKRQNKRKKTVKSETQKANGAGKIPAPPRMPDCQIT
jgi:hypothetical protein